jgi:hypothetical protein
LITSGLICNSELWLLHVESTTECTIPAMNKSVRHEDVWESGDIAPPFFISALDADDWSASSFYLLPTGRKFVVPQSRSGVEINLSLLSGTEPAFQSVALRTELSLLLKENVNCC